MKSLCAGQDRPYFFLIVVLKLMGDPICPANFSLTNTFHRKLSSFQTVVIFGPILKKRSLVRRLKNNCLLKRRETTFYGPGIILPCGTNSSLFKRVPQVQQEDSKGGKQTFGIFLYTSDPNNSLFKGPKTRKSQSVSK